jgi:hypothetical protein
MFRRKTNRLVALLVMLFFGVATTAYLAHVHGGKADHAEPVTCDLCSQMAGSAGTPSLPKIAPPSTPIVMFVRLEREQISARTPIVRSQRSRAPPTSTLA